MTSFTEKALVIIKNIPQGKVMTYGQIARLSGSPKGARQVARILHSMSKNYNLPWHRVLNAQGEISFTDSESFFVQKLALESEGVEFCSLRRVNLEKHQYHP